MQRIALIVSFFIPILGKMDGMAVNYNSAFEYQLISNCNSTLVFKKYTPNLFH